MIHQGSKRIASITSQGSKPKIRVHYPICAQDKLSVQEVMLIIILIPQASETIPALASPSSRALGHLLTKVDSWVASLRRFHS
jgi:hypothetical protein